MDIKQIVIVGIDFLKSPDNIFKGIKKKELDPFLGNYIKLLLLTSVVAGILSSFVVAGKSVYFDLFFNASINYLGMLNYAAGIGLSIFFLYLFSGTIFMFLASLVLRMLFPGKKYVDILKIMVFSAYPVLLFGWIPKAAIPLLIWSVFLFLTGIRKL